MTKKRYFDEISEFLKSREYNLSSKWLGKNTEAEILGGKSEIFFNVELIFVNILVHEWLHVAKPFLNEKEVIKETCYVVNKMKVEEIKEIGKKIMELTMFTNYK